MSAASGAKASRRRRWFRWLLALPFLFAAASVLQVLTLRFGLADGYSRTLEEVGKKFKVTRERIRQIEAKALRKLRHPSRSRKLKESLD